MKNSSKRVALCGMLVALAFIFSYIEMLIPFSLGIPGIKLGLANLVVLSCIYILSPVEVLLILIARIFLTGFLFGNMASIIYSLAGGLLSFALMLVMKKRNLFSVVGVSIIGAIGHNVGQILVAILTVSNGKLAWYLPVLMISAVITGGLVGTVSQSVLQKLGQAHLVTKTVKMKKDGYLGIVVLGIGILMTAILWKMPHEKGSSAVVHVDGKLYGVYDLSKDISFEIATEVGTNRIMIENGTVRISEADCPDGICVKHAPIEGSNEMIVCLPHKLVVEISKQEATENEVDAIVQ